MAVTGTPAEGEPRPARPATPAAFAAGARFGSFAVGALAQLGPAVTRHTAEVLRLTSRLISTTVVFMVFLQMIVGASVAIVGVYFLRSLGASDFLGLFTALGIPRVTVPLLFGFAFASKVGCGFVAEIGSMRIADELDAYDSVGLSSMRFVVATRLAACLLFVVVMFPLCVLASIAGCYLAIVYSLGDVSPSTWETVHWSLLTSQDLLFSFLQLLVITVTVAIVGMFYGFTVHGGPAQVGQATARSMIASLILVHGINALGIVVFYGTSTRLPIGGGAA